MANVPPPRSAGSRLPPPPAPAEAPQNMAVPNDTEALANMNFKVSPKLKSRVKIEASLRNMTMQDLCEAAFRFYFEQHPLDYDHKQHSMF